ncbi:MAG: VWA domain-containing protein [Pirellulaceae bacterium]|nr:VWA domain-containing protein [Pirellulaceae bacterium]
MSDGRGVEPTKGEKHSWKKKARPPSAASGGKYWATGGASKPIVSRSLVRLLAALAVLLTTTAALVLYLWNQNSSTPFISIAAIDYEHPWAPNAWAKEDQQRFQSLAQSSQFKVVVKQEKKDGTWQELIRSELEKITPGGPGGSLLPFLFGYRSAIVHLSAHGVLNHDSKPCLLFADADPLDDATWVPLAEVLNAIGEAIGEPTVGAHEIDTNHRARVLVILDTGKQPPDFRCGLLSSGFIDAARDEIKSLKFKNFAVLLSCDEEQCAWTAPEINGTVFGYMVATGLHGMADERSGSGDGNTRVTVQELADFVTASVDGYVREHRGRVQQPNLVWCGEEQDGDFDLCFKSSYTSSEVSTEQKKSRMANIKRLSIAWTEFGEWNQRAPSYDSWQRAKALARLTRAEQLLWAGSAYQTQFTHEIDLAERVFSGPANSAWPDAICGSSLVFLHRVHGRDPIAERSVLGLSLVSESQQGPSITNPAAAPGPAAATASPDTDIKSDNSDEADGKPASDAVSPPPTPAQQIIGWLTFNGQAKEGQPPPERPGLPRRSTAVGFVYAWLSDNSQFVNATVLNRFLDWIGPIPDPKSVTREEALLRTIQEHLQLTSGWELQAEKELGPLWSQYLQAADACESAIATAEPRATQCLERHAAQLLIDLQVVRDRIHGCQTDRDASDCAIDLDDLQATAQKTRDIRERLERAWRLRDELAMELPTLAQWIASPIARLQKKLPSSSDAWRLSQQLIQELAAIQVQLAAGHVPETTQLEAVEQQLENLVGAYSDSVYYVTDRDAKGQRKSVGNLMLSLGLRPNIYPGLGLSARGKLHEGLENRYVDLQKIVGQKKVPDYSTSELTEGVDRQPVWQPSDLPDDLSTSFAPLAFTEIAVGRKLSSPQDTAKSARGKLAAVGAELRDLWKARPNQLAENSRSALEAMSSLERSSIAEAEAKLQSAEYHAQLLTHLVPVSGFDDFDDTAPAKIANSVCTEQYALWQSRRALLDFWVTPALPEAFMLASSLDWQTVASRTPASGPIKLAEQLHQSTAQLASNWGDTLQSLQAGKPPDDLWRATLSLANFPTGRAWLRLALDGNQSNIRLLENDRFQLEMGTGALATKADQISIDATDLPEGNHELIAWFRGHTANAPIPIYGQDPPVTLAWQAEGPADTTIRVNVDPKPARIVFVLDCSGSMGDRRMQTAKDTLLEALRDLSHLPEGRAETAVVLFGHTAEYSKGGADDYSKWPGKKNRPYNDVEVVQGLVSPTPSVISELQDKLANLKCWGRTPLYEAIRQSVDLLIKRHDGFAGDLRVVVITDGDDNVFPYPDGLAGNAKAKGAFLVPNEYIHTVQSAIGFAAGRVSLDFVAFNFKPGVGGDANKLETMARQTGGKVYQAGDQDLADQLRNSIARDTYSTRNLTTKRTIGTAIRLSDELHVDPSQLPGQFEVQIDNTTARKTVALLGGETIELQYQRQQLGLSFLPHDEGDMYPEPGEFHYGDQPYKAIMLRGKPDNVPQIHMCLQSSDPARQSLRPGRFLLEVRRVRSGESGGERIAWSSDALWENHHRSPVLRVTFKNLPELQRDWLETRLWIAQPDSGDRSQRLSVARFKEQAVQVAPGVSASAETRTEAGGLRLTLTENRQTDSPLIHWQVLPIPDKFVEHQIHDKKTVHEFFFSDAQVQNQIELTATPLPEVAGDDWQATPWLRIPAWK